MAKLERSQMFDMGCAGASLACAIHCALLPFLVASLPALGLSFFAGELFEWVLVISSLVLASASICFGIKFHRSRRAVPVLLVGAVLLLAARFAHEPHISSDSASASHGLETVALAAAGGVLVAIAHLINIKLCRSCRSCEGSCS